MNMVRHQRPGPAFDFGGRAVRVEQIAIERIILVAEKVWARLLPRYVAGLGVSWEDGACQPWHRLGCCRRLAGAIKCTAPEPQLRHVAGTRIAALTSAAGALPANLPSEGGSRRLEISRSFA